MGKKKIRFMCTAFRDGFQSVFGARVLTEDFLPAVEAAVDAGIDYFESGGGARFQSLFFYCNENAFDMMDSFRKTVGPDVELQTLGRGVNVVGLESQSEDIIKLHAKLFKKHGVTSIRNFDALNDYHNLIHSGQAITDEGLNHQVSVTMMALPPGCTGAHDPDFYEQTLKEILDAGIPYKSVCFKDASGTATPAVVYETMKRARKMLPEGTVIHFHTHETAGTGTLCNKAAIEGGADQIDLSMSPVSGGTGQPDVLTMWHALRGTDFELDVDVDKVVKAERVFKDCMKDYFMPPEARAVEPMIPWSPMPGGALTANTQMLRDNNIMDKFPAIIDAMKEVVERGGFGTSVTPVSQFYFQQAFNNVLFGNWKKIAPGYGKMVLGYFGKTPTKPDPEIVKLASEQLELQPTERPVVELNNEDSTKGVEMAKKMLSDAGIEETEDNIFIAATCKEKGIDFLLGKAQLGVRKIEKKDEKQDESGSGKYTVTLEGKKYSVSIEGDKTVVNGKEYNTDIKEGIEEGSDKGSDSSKGGGGVEVTASMPGKIFKMPTEVGEAVEKGDTILILEAMKMETEVKAPEDGTIVEFMVEVGDQVGDGDVLAVIE